MRGRPPKPTQNKNSTITIKIPGSTKNEIVALAEGYGLTITEYLLTLVERDASPTIQK
jgi:antitoxin component of RelBE/YafQ-DinJ toxin-antitoxin module